MEAFAWVVRAPPLSDCARAFTATAEALSMPAPHGAEDETVAYRGEVWTNTGGYATVELPTDADALLPPFEYELRDLDPPTSARVTAELSRGRFTIATADPHVKVGWRIKGRRRQGEAETSQEERR
jgi:hypothetical protein